MNFDWEKFMVWANKSFYWIFPSLFAVAAKLAFDSRKKKITIAYAFTSIIIACFIGWILDKMCTKMEYESTRGIIIAIGALLSDTFMQYVFTNGNNIISTMISMFTKTIDKQQKNDKENGT